MADRQSVGSNKKGLKIFLISSAGVLVAALAIMAVLLLGDKTVTEDRVVRVMEYGTVLKGVSINGIDLSGMTADEARAATAEVETQMLAQAVFNLDVNGTVVMRTSQDFQLYTDYADVITNAVEFGHTGSFEDRLQAANEARDTGMDFPVNVLFDEAKLSTALATLKTELDTEPIDATATFMPWGYTLDADGNAVPWQPDVKAMADAQSKGNEYEQPNLVRIPDAEKPLALRYQYWDNDEYVKDYIPRDWNIARFMYTPEVTGIVVNTQAIYDQIVSQVQSGSYTTITVPVEVTEPQVKLADIKSSTILISSWSSSFGGGSHYGTSRNWNVSRMSSFINGGVILPGEQWTVNTVAGPRNSTTAKSVGWKEAAGIENGGYTAQVGGGVCQLGSTVYNAAIRAGVTIASSTHHTIPSDYIPLGLDATLSTPKPDLVLKNDNTMPVYIVSYVNPKDRNVTVEIYGQQPVDPTYGAVIYDFTSNNKGTRYGTPTPKTITSEVPITAPDGTVVNASNPKYEYAKSRKGTSIQTYKHIYSLDGKELCDPIAFEKHNYPVINGTIYVYSPPVVVTPTPPPSEPTPAPTTGE